MFFIQEKAAAVDFVDRKGDIREPMKPLSLGETPFKLVEELKDLREMCTKLKSATEIAVSSSFMSLFQFISLPILTLFMFFLIVSDHCFLSTTIASLVA